MCLRLILLRTPPAFYSQGMSVCVFYDMVAALFFLYVASSILRYNINVLIWFLFFSGWLVYPLDVNRYDMIFFKLLHLIL